MFATILQLNLTVTGFLHWCVQRYYEHGNCILIIPLIAYEPAYR